jgi:hypothetical protein
MRPVTLSCSLVAAICLPIASAAQMPQLISTRDSRDWQTIAREFGLPDQDREQLARDKVLITREEFKQVFAAYIGPRLPVFVTSDSLLAAYGVLFEDAVTSFEQAQAPRLPPLLKRLWIHLDRTAARPHVTPELQAAALRRDRIVLAVAMALLGQEPVGLTPDIRRIVREELTRVKEASAILKPSWLGPPDQSPLALDYSRFRPRGVYAGDVAMERYFRACAWLQAIPFDVARDEELLAFALLAAAARAMEAEAIHAGPMGRRPHGPGAEAQSRHMDFGDWVRGRSAFFGSADDRDLGAAIIDFESCDLKPGGRGLARCRASVVESVERYKDPPAVNDQVVEPSTGEVSRLGHRFRILSSTRLDDAVLLQRLIDLDPLRVWYPGGIPVAAALGSELARQELAGETEAVRAAVTLPKVGGFYQRYLHVLAALAGPPAADAPAFMRGLPWQRKSCNAMLSGWALERHALILPAKENALYGGIEMTPAGFVEPQSEFFSRLAALAEDMEQLLSHVGAYDVDGQALAHTLRAQLPKVDALLRRRERRVAVLADDSVESFFATLALFGRLGDAAIPSREVLMARARRLIDELASGRHDDRAVLLQMREAKRAYALDHWLRLALLCRRLEALSYKELRGQALSTEDEGLLMSFGEKLAGIMLYDGNSYLVPNDDAPRVADILTNPNEGRHLHVGVGRPRALYVLYPYDGREVVCRGAVLPYFELIESSRMNDAEWRKRLDSTSPPTAPTWLTPIIGTHTAPLEPR